MVALAAIVNKVAPDDNSISLFYNTGNAQIALAFKTGTKDGDDPDNQAWSADANDYNGYILNPSSMGGASYRGRDFVVAVTMPNIDPGAPLTSVQVSIVSPVYQKLASPELDNNNVAMCSSGDEAWVYYLAGSGSTQRTMREINLATGSTTDLKPIYMAFSNSSVAAWYDPVEKKRHVIFESSAVMEFAVGDQNPAFIQATGDIARNASLAVSYCEGKVYLYYYSSNYVVRRVVKDGTWGGAQDVDNCPLISADSQIAVVPANGVNHLFFVAKEQATKKPGPADYFTHVRDPL